MQNKLKLKKGEKLGISRAFTLVSQIGLNMTVMIGGCLLLGQFLDEKLNTSPWFMIGFIIFGVLGAFWNLYQVSMREVDPNYTFGSAKKNIEKDKIKRN